MNQITFWELMNIMKQTRTNYSHYDIHGLIDTIFSELDFSLLGKRVMQQQLTEDMKLLLYSIHIFS